MTCWSSGVTRQPRYDTPVVTGVGTLGDKKPCRGMTRPSLCELGQLRYDRPVVI